MKKHFTVTNAAIVAVVLALAYAAYANIAGAQTSETWVNSGDSCIPIPEEKKVDICHKTSSESNPWEQINVAVSAWENTHSGHGDFLVTEQTPCPPIAEGDDDDDDTPPVGDDDDDDTPPTGDDDDDDTPPSEEEPPRNNGGAGPCLNCGDDDDDDTPRGDDDDDDDSEEPPSTTPVDVCVAPSAPTMFNVATGVPNDNTLELTWNIAPNYGATQIRWGVYDGLWTHQMFTKNDGQHSLTGLTNGQHIWLQVRGITLCGWGDWSVSIDPLP